MKKYEHLGKGSIIYTIDGFFKINTINQAGLVYTDEYIYDVESERMVKQPDEAMLTKQDIEKYMKEYDRINHYVILDY